MAQLPEEGLLQFPCDYVFKAFGPAEPESRFEETVFHTVAGILPIGRDSLRTRGSSGGNYLCVSILVRVHNRAQLEKIYLALREIPDLRYLL